MTSGRKATLRMIFYRENPKDTNMNGKEFAVLVDPGMVPGVANWGGSWRLAVFLKWPSGYIDR